jgi:hypothetical protein
MDEVVRLLEPVIDNARQAYQTARIATGVEARCNEDMALATAHAVSARQLFAKAAEFSNETVDKLAAWGEGLPEDGTRLKAAALSSVEAAKDLVDETEASQATAGAALTAATKDRIAADLELDYCTVRVQ